MFLILNEDNNSIIEISYEMRIEIAKQCYIDILDYYKNKDHIILLLCN